MLELTRGDSTDGDWQGTVVVWECLGAEATDGFTLVDVTEVSCASGGSTSEQITNATANTAWSDLDQVALIRRPSRRRLVGSSGGAADHTSFCAKLTPSGTNAIAVARHGGGSSLLATTFTVYVVQWGSHHTIQRVNLTGSAAATAPTPPPEYDTATISEVTRANTWCWMSGWSDDNGDGDGFWGLTLALGDGVDLDDTETSVAVGSEYTDSRDVLVTVHSHGRLDVDWQFKSDGDSTETSHAYDVPGALVAETRDSSSTAGTRVPLQTQTVDGTGNAFQRSLWWTRHTDETDLDADRTGAGADWTAWLQSIDTGPLTRSLVAHDGDDSAAFRITTYQLGSGAFTGTSYTLQLDQDLARHYFVMILGAQDANPTDADNLGVRVSADPFGHRRARHHHPRRRAHPRTPGQRRRRLGRDRPRLGVPRASRRRRLPPRRRQDRHDGRRDHPQHDADRHRDLSPLGRRRPGRALRRPARRRRRPRRGGQTTSASTPSAPSSPPAATTRSPSPAAPAPTPERPAPGPRSRSTSSSGAATTSSSA